MAGMYPSFPAAMKSIIRSDGVRGFYTGWWPALAQKIPSYGLTWMFFQQLKRLHESLLGTSPSGEVSFGLGAFASATAVAFMIPMDTIKTRLVTQVANNPRAYKGVRDCFTRVLREEGVGAFYRSLPPRLMSVVRFLPHERASSSALLIHNDSPSQSTYLLSFCQCNIGADDRHPVRRLRDDQGQVPAGESGAATDGGCETQTTR